jgi:hypothetical protein
MTYRQALKKSRQRRIYGTGCGFIWRGTCGSRIGTADARLKEAGQQSIYRTGRLQEFVAEKEQEFRTELAKQKADAQD